jgi:EmrB/QacA subfamily drug resistance transporter
MKAILGKYDGYDADSTGTASSARMALASLSLSILMSAFDTSIANAGLPTMAVAFEASFQEVQWIVLAYLLAMTTLIVGVGRLGDLVGRKLLLLAGIALFTLASLLCGIAPTLGLLVAARAAQGLGAAVMMVLTVAMVGETVPTEKTGSAMGLLGTMSAVGTTLGPSLGGVLMAGFGWRVIFLVNVPLGILNFYAANRYLPDSRAARQNRERFDVAGTSLLAVTLAAYALAMTIGRGHFGALNFGLLAAALFGTVCFMFVERNAVSPLIELKMFRDLRLSAGLAAAGLVSTVMMATLVVGPFYLSRGLGFETASVGFILAAGPLVSALTGVPAGRLADRFGARRLVVAGLVGVGVGSLLLALMPAQFGVVGYLVSIVFTTAHYAMFQAANNTVVMTGIPADRRGVVSGILSLSRNLGLITGASVMGAVFSFASGTTEVSSARPEAVAFGMRVTFIVAAFLMTVAVALVLGGMKAARQPSAR